MSAAQASSIGLRSGALGRCLGLVPAASDHDESLTLQQVVDAVPQLGDPVAHGSDVTGIAGGQTVDPHLHAGRSSPILEPA